MLCVKLLPFIAICGPNTGGISDILLFDREDFDFTQADAGADGAIPGYTAIALRTGATFETGAKFFAVKFKRKEAEYTIKRAADSPTYTHLWKFLLPGNSQNTTNFLMSLDAATNCCGIGVLFRTNDGKIWVGGEKYVNGSEITDFYLEQQDSDGTSGKVLADPAGINLAIGGDYNRPLYEFLGDWDAIVTLRDGAAE